MGRRVVEQGITDIDQVLVSKVYKGEPLTGEQVVKVRC